LSWDARGQIQLSLTAAILRIRRMRLRVFPLGPDQGVDILAGPVWCQNSD
jgi:hypothetical protein